MINGDVRCRVYNKCKYDIGVALSNGLNVNIKPGSFQVMTINDILHIESICNSKKFFASGMLEAVTNDGESLNLEELGIAFGDEQEKHMDDDMIVAALKQPAKKLEAWLNGIEDPSELHAIYEVAVSMDLPASKLKILNEHIPDKDWLDAE